MSSTIVASGSGRVNFLCACTVPDRSTFHSEAHHSSTKAAELFFALWDLIIASYPHDDKLKMQIYHDVATRTELARAFYGNAPLIANSLVTYIRTMCTVYVGQLGLPSPAGREDGTSQITRHGDERCSAVLENMSF